MSIERYIEASVATLRDDVLPMLPEGPARDQLVNCLRVLMRTVIALERKPEASIDLYGNESLPEELREAFRIHHRGDPDLPFITEDIVVDTITSHGLETAAAWIASHARLDEAAPRQTIRTLLAWDKRQRDQRLSRMAAAETQQAADTPALVSGGKLSEQVLLHYLRDKLGNPALRIEQYRLLPGGRTRKTVLFRQRGHDDWPEWLVVQCDPPPGYHAFPGVSSQFPVIAYAHAQGKLKVPRPLLLELNADHFGTAFMIVERLAGSPPRPGLNFFAAPPRSEALALDMARQLAALHSLPVAPVEKSVPVLLPDASGWPGDLDQLTARIAQEFAGPSLSIAAAFAWMRTHVDAVRDTVSIVHGDFLQHNLLVEGEAVSGILDWEGTRIGHPGEDLGYVRPMIEQMTTWDNVMAAYHAAGGPAFSREEGDYFTLRAYILMLTHIAHSKNGFEAGRVDDIRAAEVSCSLAPLFVDCVARTMEKILSR